MAGSWRVSVEGVRELDNPKYRVGDFAKMLVHEDVKIRNAVIEASLVGNDVFIPGQTTKPFNVDDSGQAKIDQVLFVPRPQRGEAILLRVVKPHKLQKDALIGEVEIRQPAGRQRLQLFRGGKPRGFILVNITEGIPVPPTPATGSTVSSSSRAPPPGPPTNTRSIAPAFDTAKPAAASASTMSKQAPAGTSMPSVAGDRPADSSSKAAAGGGMLGSCFEGVASCLEVLMAKSLEAASDRAMLQPIVATLGLEDGKTFLERKSKDSAVLRRPSGLMYRVLRTGTGRHHPGEDTPCECHYKGRLVDGKEFDSSYRSGKPARFVPRNVIKGWSEALQLMVEGDRWELFIPPELAYGDRGVDALIPPGSVLVFEVELLKVGKK